MKYLFLILTTVVLVGAGVVSPVESAQSFGALTLTEITPRIITPNGDLHNDVIFFKFDSSLTSIPITTGVFDITGAKIADLKLGLNETALTWDGKDNGGKVVSSGVYIYSINIGNNSATGTIVVAR
jgi:hypothetical protein